MKNLKSKIKNQKFAFVVSSYHAEYTAGMVAAAERELVGHTINVFHVPGAFEIPLAVQRAARTKKYDAVLAFGLIWQGQTQHAQEILRACTDALMRIGLENDLPVLHEVLSVRTAAEAKARCLGTRMNRGTEAARAALALLESSADIL